MSRQTDLAYRAIKEMIFCMELLPGMRIPEVQLASRISVSRTPIHDALRQLAAEGLVTVNANRGAIVTQFTGEQIQEIGALRLAQDVLSAQLAAYYGSTADFDRLDRLALSCEEAAAQGDVYGRIRIDNDFHLEIAKISGNRQLIRQQFSLYQQIHLIQISKYTDVADSLQQIHHHKPIVEALRGRSESTLRTLICQHIQDFFQLDPYLMQCYSGAVRT